MKITQTEIWTVVVPTIPGTVHSEIYGPVGWERIPLQIIRVHTDEGIYGIGETGWGTSVETVQDFARRIEGKDPLKLCLQQIPRDLSTEPSKVERDWESVGEGGYTEAYEAFETAIFDIVGKALGLPVHALLGGAFRNRVKVDYWIGHQTPEDSARNARIAKERGFRGLKMKCTIDESIIERILAIKDVVGSDFKITVDPNQRFYRPSEAIALSKELEKIGTVAALEDPLPKWNLDWYKQIREASSIPIALHLGGSFHGIINAIKAEAVDYMNLGGCLVRFVKNATIADAAGILCWHGSGNQLGVIETAFVHAASVARNCVLPSDLVGSWTREDDLIVDGLVFENGETPVPMKPGLGCELDMDAIEKYRIA
ncbi:MAG: mandelate racemase/muconate lactonizing enzyme family protein [Candidatus Latescibacteria bacterium]|nr:mandelate racemase/muconate lactonizing enzyme family protein [Candidatus Latescibacterota bacterium]